MLRRVSKSLQLRLAVRTPGGAIHRRAPLSETPCEGVELIGPAAGSDGEHADGSHRQGYGEKQLTRSGRASSALDRNVSFFRMPDHCPSPHLSFAHPAYTPAV